MISSLSRKKAHRESMLRNLVTSLILYEKIETTEAKAKLTRQRLELLINRARSNDFKARRTIKNLTFDPKAVQKIFEVILPRYQDKKTGFIKIYKINQRLGDNAPKVVIALEKVKPKVDLKDTKIVKETKNASPKENQDSKSKSTKDQKRN